MMLYFYLGKLFIQPICTVHNTFVCSNLYNMFISVSYFLEALQIFYSLLFSDLHFNCIQFLFEHTMSDIIMDFDFVGIKRCISSRVCP